MGSTKNLLINHMIKAAGLRAEFGSYRLNRHLSGKGPKGRIPRITCGFYLWVGSGRFGEITRQEI